MRRRVKRELCGILRGLHRAHQALENSAADVDIGRQFGQLLEDCQNCAVEAGNLIESTEGEGTQAVAYLEEYCELAWQYMQADSARQRRRICGEMAETINRAENSVIHDISEQYEVVFLPYKASMWDSLESVWLAARADPECNSYVMPIPYYDRNSDGTLGTLHWEADQFPGDVPITAIDQYDLAERHPDVIYIHNPYDHLNRVTCVHPAFFSKAIHDYTDVLVYIPYFISAEDVAEHFCVLPGTIYADIVIVQSEQVRDTYIREYDKYAEENQCQSLLGRGKDKFLALGSPKLDRVRNITLEGVVIPEEWKPMLDCGKGTGKKVILYNTTIDAFLKHGSAWLKKIRLVLDIFRKNPEVVLLWRPHPLLEATGDSMRPELAGQYREIVRQYREGQWGIFDDTADLERAIALSDAYYGDWSSVVELYKETGKPIMIQNLSTEEQNDGI